MAPSFISWILFVIFIVSIPFYSLFLITLHKFRKKDPFNAPFFRISFFIGFSDIAQLMNSYFLHKFAKWGWFSQFYLSQAQSWLPKFGFTMAYYLGINQHLGVVILSLTRFTALNMPFQDNHIWEARGLKNVLIAFQWIFPIMAVAPAAIFAPIEYLQIGNSSAVHIVWGDPFWEECYDILGIVMNVSCNITSLVLYLLIFVNFWKKRKEQNNFVSGLVISIPSSKSQPDSGSKANRNAIGSPSFRAKPPSRLEIIEVRPVGNGCNLSAKNSPISARKTVTVNNRKSHGRRCEWQLATCGFVMFVVMLLYGVFLATAALSGARSTANNKSIGLQLWFIASDALSWLNAYMIFAMSRIVRKHVKMTLLCKQ